MQPSSLFHGEQSFALIEHGYASHKIDVTDPKNFYMGGLSNHEGCCLPNRNQGLSVIEICMPALRISHSTEYLGAIIQVPM